MFELSRIVLSVSQQETPAKQMQSIVNAITEVLRVDVCSVYRLEQSGDMRLLASHGLKYHHPVVIPAGKGLVGRVASSRHSLNICDVSTHPDNYYIPETGEKRFNSFCGVPLVRFGEVMGVLVVQSKKNTKLEAESEAFLITLASHLALILAEKVAFSKPLSTENQRIKGIVGSPGVSIGFVQLCDGTSLEEVAETYHNNLELELQRWKDLLTETRENIRKEQSALGTQVSDSVSGIFEAYQMLLSDHALSERVASEIRAGFSLPSALKLSIRYFADIFKAMDDPYLKARYEDMIHLGNKLFHIWRGGADVEAKQEYPSGSIILVGPQVSVSDIAAVPNGKLVGVICFEGSALSHTAILSNALGVPALLGMDDECKAVKHGEHLIVDANTGVVIRHSSKNVLSEYRQLMNKNKQFTKQLDQLRDLPAETKESVNIRLYTNTGLLADVGPGIRNGAEGVGLYRTEIPFIIRQSFPNEDEQVQVYKQVLDAYKDKPVYIRTLDIGGDKQLPYFPIDNEENPALGWRGIRFTLDNIQLLMTQVRAILRAGVGRKDLHILLPMVSATWELNQFFGVLDDARNQLIEEGVDSPRPKVGVMVEVPAAISQLTLWRDKIDFISVGSNDLSQYLLALDRNNGRVAYLYDHVHPAVLREINRIVDIGREIDLPISICGEMASDPVAVILLLGMGVRNLSISSAKLPRIKWLIRSISIYEAKRLLSRAMLIDDADSIRAEGIAFIKEKGLNELIS